MDHLHIKRIKLVDFSYIVTEYNTTHLGFGPGNRALGHTHRLIN
jgi:hypothetical protein